LLRQLFCVIQVALFHIGAAAKVAILEIVAECRDSLRSFLYFH
jgi:hypothetical protein